MRADIDTANILSVKELNLKARSLLERELSTVWVMGEISNLARPQSGHWYFTLKDEVAQVRCAMFRGHNSRIAFDPKVGEHLLAHGRVSLYEGRGDYQLIVDYLEPMGEGMLQKKFEALKLKLSLEGLFETAQKKSLPVWPRAVIVITSPTGAALQDILNVLNRRFKALPIYLVETQVQGEKAADALADALSWVNQDDQFQPDKDVILLARGGGSLEDLWPFNEEKVARAIYASRLPVVTGIGHEIDFTISDLVGDVRAPTPSAAAELISQNEPELRQNLIKRAQSMVRVVSHQIHQQRQHVRHQYQRFPRLDRDIAFLNQSLDLQSIKLAQSYQHIVQRYRQQWQYLSRRLQHPKQRLDQYQERLNALVRRAHRALRVNIQQCRQQQTHILRRFNALLIRQKLDALHRPLHQQQQRLMNLMVQHIHLQRLTATLLYKQLDNLSPLAVLARGYALVYRQGEDTLITGVNQLKIKDSVNIQLSDGSVTATIQQLSATQNDPSERE